MSIGSKRYKITTGATGEQLFLYDESADIGAIEDAYTDVMEELRDPVTGDFTTEGVNRLQILTRNPANYARLTDPAKAHALRVQAKARQHLAEIRAMAQVASANTELAICFKQLGYGVTIPSIFVRSPRNVPAFLLFYMAEARTQRSIGVAQITYASIPLIDNQQEPAYSAFGAGLVTPWISLSFALNQYHCDTRRCQPKLPAGSILYNDSPVKFDFVQIASVGDDAIAAQDHSLTLGCVTTIKCVDDRNFERAAKEAVDEVRGMRGSVGNLNSMIR